MVEVREVLSRKDRKRFFKFPIDLYRDSEYFVPNLIADEMDTFNPNHNPAFAYSECRLWLAERNGKVVGRIGAILNKAANEKENSRQLRFTRYDFVDDYEVSEALFNAAVTWARELGMTELRGPLGFSNLDQQGMLTDGFEQMDMYITIYNYPYYKDHMERLGLEKKWDWVERKIFCGREVPERVARMGALCQERYGYRLKEFKSMSEVKPYINEAMRIINTAFEKLHGIVPLSDRQIANYTKLVMLVGNPEYCLIVTNPEDKVVAFGFMAPSISNAIRRGHGRIGPLTLIRLFEDLRDHTHLDMYMIAVRPEDHLRGIESLILGEGMRRAIRHNCADFQTGPMQEDNIKIQNVWKHWEHIIHRRRRCWTYNIPE